MSDILNMNITISAVEQKTAKNGNVFFKLKDENNLTYTMWTTKKDGSEQPCFSYFKTLGFDAVGKTVSIGYKEEQSEYDGKAVTYRTIIGMRAVDSTSGVTQSVLSPSSVETRLSVLETKVALLMGKLEAIESVPTFCDEPLKETDEGFVKVSEITF